MIKLVPMSDVMTMRTAIIANAININPVYLKLNTKAQMNAGNKATPRSVINENWRSTIAGVFDM